MSKNANEADGTTPPKSYSAAVSGQQKAKPLMAIPMKTAIKPPGQQSTQSQANSTAQQGPQQHTQPSGSQSALPASTIIPNRDALSPQSGLAIDTLVLKLQAAFDGQSVVTQAIQQQLQQQAQLIEDMKKQMCTAEPQSASATSMYSTYNGQPLQQQIEQSNPAQQRTNQPENHLPEEHLQQRFAATIKGREGLKREISGVLRGNIAILDSGETIPWPPRGTITSYTIDEDDDADETCDVSALDDIDQILTTVGFEALLISIGSTNATKIKLDLWNTLTAVLQMNNITTTAQLKEKLDLLITVAAATPVPLSSQAKVIIKKALYAVRFEVISRQGYDVASVRRQVKAKESVKDVFAQVIAKEKPKFSGPGIFRKGGGATAYGGPRQQLHTQRQAKSTASSIGRGCGKKCGFVFKEGDSWAEHNKICPNRK